MLRTSILGAACALALLSAACDDAQDTTPAPFEWELPPGFPEPKVPADNPMSHAKVELGRHLFYDTRLSGNQTQSCASCHDQALAFTDGRATALGSTGEAHFRNSMALVNVAYSSVLTWANPAMNSLERQVLVPMFGELPVELGLAGKDAELIERLATDSDYPALFARAFPADPDPISLANITKAIAAFQRTLLSGDSSFDRFGAGDDAALSESARRGETLFFSERLECHHCHGGFNFSLSTTFLGKRMDEISFSNTGLYDVDGMGGYPASDPGLFEVTNNPDDMGKFRAPTLRNIAVTAPYMHDGSMATLEDVVDFYARGGGLIETGTNAGDGAMNPHKSNFITGFTLTPTERQDLLAFLRSLTDETFLTDPRFQSPF